MIDFIHKSILPDYLDGSCPLPKNQGENTMLNVLSSISKSCEDVEVHRSEMTLTPMLSGLLKTMGFDTTHGRTLRSFIRCWSDYSKCEKEKANYIYSKLLSESLANCRSDIPLEFLPERFTAFLQMPFIMSGVDVQTINGSTKANCLHEGSFVSIKDERITIVSFFTSSELGVSYEPIYNSYDMSDKSLSVDEMFNNYHQGEGEKQLSKEVMIIIMRAIIYAENTPDDIIEYLQTIPRSSNKRAKFLRKYTSKRLRILGQYFTMPKTYSDKDIVNRGHFAFRRVGVGRTGLKYVWVNQSKPYRKGV